MTRRADPTEIRARELAVAAGIDPDSRISKPGTDSERGMPAWCGFRELAKAEYREQKAAANAALFASLRPQEPQYQNSPLKIFGEHDVKTLDQMRACMSVGNAAAGAICADGHLGYSMPVGGVIGYENQVSISGVGFDIGCGNGAVRLDVKFAAIQDHVATILDEVWKVISFGVGRSNSEKVEDALFDDDEAWQTCDMESYRQKAVSQLGTVGGGNHYVDLMVDEEGYIWIGVHFGSRGFGHTTATRYLKEAGGTDGMFVPPTVVDEDSELGIRYIAGMHLAGRYAFAGRAWVLERVRAIIGGNVTDRVSNHHNSAWKEKHVINGVERELWVVRKGATPAFPGQRGFVGGSMGDDAVIIEGIDSPEARNSLYSTVHGAGRVFSRTQAIKTFKWSEMDEWLKRRGVMLRGGDLDESPMAYRRLPDVLAHHAGSVKVLHTLRPFAVAMAGKGTFDPFKD